MIEPRPPATPPTKARRWLAYRATPTVDLIGITRITEASRTWSRPGRPTGTKIAFATNRHGGSNLELYTMTATGGSQTRVTIGPAVDWFPDW